MLSSEWQGHSADSSLGVIRLLDHAHSGRWKLKYFAWILLAKFALSITIGYAIADLYPGLISPEKFLETRRQVAALLVLPFMETLVIQLGIIEIVRILFSENKKSFGTWIGAILSAIVFFLLHYQFNGAFNGWAYGLIGGIAFGSMYALNRKSGAKLAFFCTWMLHLASNALLLISFMFFAKVIGA